MTVLGARSARFFEGSLVVLTYKSLARAVRDFFEGSLVVLTYKSDILFGLQERILSILVRASIFEQGYMKYMAFLCILLYPQNTLGYTLTPQSDAGCAGIARARRRGHLAKSARPWRCAAARGGAISRRTLGARRTRTRTSVYDT